MRGYHPWGLRAASLLACLGGVASVGCVDPTQATLELTTDVGCDRLAETSIAVGGVDTVESLEANTTTSDCAGEEIGTIAVVPAGEPDEPWALKVVSGVGVLASQCQPPEYGPACIVARRSLRYVEHENLRVPIAMRESCLGVLCPADQTCVDGECRAAAIDPEDCLGDEGCGEGNLKPTDGEAWQLGFGGAEDDLVHDVAAVVGGDVLITGNLSSAVDFGGGLLDPGDTGAAFVARFGPDGAHRWSKSFGGAAGDAGVAVWAGQTGILHVAGNFGETIDFGTGALSSAGETDAFLATFGGFGEPRWSLAMGGPGADSVLAVTADGSDDIYVVGRFTDTMTIDGVVMPGTGEEGFLASFDAAGGLRWAKSIGGAGSDAAGAVAVDDAGRVYVAGSFEQTVQLGDLSLVTTSARDAFVACFRSEDGEPLWAHGFGDPTGNDHGFEVAVDAAQERVAISGALAGPAAFDGHLLQATADDGFLIVVDLDGNHQWSLTFGGAGAEGGEALAYDDEGRLYLGGYYGGTVEIAGETVTGKGFRDLFVAAFDTQGEGLWVQPIAAADFASLRGIAPGGAGSVFAGGFFGPELTFGEETLTSAGMGDMFVARILPPGTSN